MRIGTRPFDFAQDRLPATGSSIIKAKIVGFALCAMLFAFSSSADAQQLTKVPRVGFVAPGSLSLLGFDELQRGLREIGYVEGRNIAIELRSAEGKHGRLAALATELVRLPVDVLVIPPKLLARADRVIN